MGVSEITQKEEKSEGGIKNLRDKNINLTSFLLFLAKLMQAIETRKFAF